MADTMTCPRCRGTGRIPDPHATGERARRNRLVTGQSLRAFARRVGCSPSHMCDLELGRRAWTGPVARRALQLLDIPARDDVTDEGAAPTEPTE